MKNAIILENKNVAINTNKMVLFAPIKNQIICGQFVHIQLLGKKLRRPFCICDFSVENSTITIVYQVVGEGTSEMAGYPVGTKLDILFPLGNGFSVTEEQKTVFLVGGGLGCAVLPSALKCFAGKTFYSFLGFENKSKAILIDELKLGGQVFIATEDGSLGEKGYVTDILAKQIELLKPDVIFSCGPKPMLKALKAISDKYDISHQVSLEERMGCGIGACLVCTCKIKKKSGEMFLRVCKDGPVFNINEVIYE